MRKFLTSIADKLHAALFGYMHNMGAVACLMADPTDFGFDAGAVVNPGQSEVIRQRLYDYQLYATAGVGQLSFFQQPVGAGLTTALGGTVGQAKSYADTNMQLAGQLPSGMAFKVESIEVAFYPGSVATASTYTIAAVGQWAAVSAAALTNQVNDVNTFYQSGLLEFNILQKNYLRETPLQAFPPKTALDLFAAHASNSATTAQTSSLRAVAGGRPYYLDLPVTLKPAINFEVVLKWPGAVATPSGFNARVGVILDGLTMRASQ